MNTFDWKIHEKKAITFSKNHEKKNTCQIVI